MRYWIYKDSSIQGPFSREEVGRLDDLDPETLVCHEGAGGRQENDWQALREFPELADLVFAAALTGPAAGSAEDALDSSFLGGATIDEPETAPPRLTSSFEPSPARQWEEFVDDSRFRRGGDAGRAESKARELDAQVKALQRRIDELERQQDELLRQLSAKSRREEELLPQLAQKDLKVEALHQKLENVESEQARLLRQLAEKERKESALLPRLYEKERKVESLLQRIEEMEAQQTDLLRQFAQRGDAGSPVESFLKRFEELESQKSGLMKLLSAPEIPSAPQAAEKPAPPAADFMEPAEIAAPFLPPAPELFPPVRELPPEEPPAVAEREPQSEPEPPQMAAPKSWPKAVIAPAESAKPKSWPKAAAGPADGVKFDAPKQFAKFPVAPAPPAVSEPLLPPEASVPAVPAPAAAASAPLPAFTPAPAPAAEPIIPPLPQIEAPVPIVDLAAMTPPAPALQPPPTPTTADLATGTEEVISRLAKKAATTAAPKAPPRPRSKKLMLGVAAAFLGLLGVGFLFFQNGKELKMMFTMGSSPSPAAEEEEALPEKAENPSVAPPAANPASQGIAAPEAYKKLEIAADPIPLAIDLVKNHALGGDRGTIGQWLQYSFSANPGDASHEKWDAGAVDATTYLVQYTIQRTAGREKSLREPITYLFEADLSQKTVLGKNAAARQLLGGGRPSRARPFKKPARRKKNPAPGAPAIKKKAQAVLLPEPVPTDLPPSADGEGAFSSDTIN